MLMRVVMVRLAVVVLTFGVPLIIAILDIDINMKNVPLRILVKVIVFFIPVFVLIQAVLWEENIKSAVNQTAAAVPVQVVQTPGPALPAVSNTSST